MNARERTYQVLFLCTGNSARSILAEAILGRVGHGQFRAYSAGSFPKGRVHPMALDVLRARRYETDGLRSKSWDEFAALNGIRFDFVITVCDNAAGEACPVWLGHPMTAHWGIPDPAAVTGTELEKKLAFQQAFAAMQARIERFLSLPIESIEKLRLKECLDEIGRTPPEPAQP